MIVSGSYIVDSIENHKGISSVREFNINLKDVDINSDGLNVFLASLLAFNRHVAAGIAIFSGRLVDDLIAEHPFDAHNLSALILRSASDEFGVGGHVSHAELFATFAESLGVSREYINTSTNAIPAALLLGQDLFKWYRASSVSHGLGVHLASEMTSAEEFNGWSNIFFSPPFNLPCKSDGSRYITEHEVIEEEHASEIATCIDSYLILCPDEGENILKGARQYMDEYQKMFEDLIFKCFSRN